MDYSQTFYWWRPRFVSNCLNTEKFNAHSDVLISGWCSFLSTWFSIFHIHTRSQIPFEKLWIPVSFYSPKPSFFIMRSKYLNHVCLIACNNFFVVPVLHKKFFASRIVFSTLLVKLYLQFFKVLLIFKQILHRISNISRRTIFLVLKVIFLLFKEILHSI